jgi:hypothetical protein
MISPRRNDPIFLSLLSLVTFSSSLVAAAATKCSDNNDNCNFWASQGECQSNPGFMHANCPVSCGTCVELTQEDLALINDSAKYGVKQLVQVCESNLSLVLLIDDMSSNYVYTQIMV